MEQKQEEGGQGQILMKTRKGRAERNWERREQSEGGEEGKKQVILELKNKVHLLEKRLKPQVNVQERKKNVNNHKD